MVVNQGGGAGENAANSGGEVVQQMSNKMPQVLDCTTELLEGGHL